VILEPFINQLHDDESAPGYLQQDGATAHSTRTTITMLREFFDNRLINRNTENIWPPRFCDLTPFLWSYLLCSQFTRLMPGFWNGPITNWPVKSDVAIETVESNQSHYRIFIFIGELTNWPDKIVSRNRAIMLRITAKLNEINSNPGMLQKSFVKLGLEQHGEHFHHLL
jgi:hypothetical protein